MPLMLKLAIACVIGWAGMALAATADPIAVLVGATAWFGPIGEPWRTVAQSAAGLGLALGLVWAVAVLLGAVMRLRGWARDFFV